MPRSLADGHQKLILLTTEPEDPANPTLAELTAGIDASLNILLSDFQWSATASDTVSEQAVGEAVAADVLTTSKFQASVTPFRYFDSSTKNPDPTEDAVFQALKAKGSRLWGYLRNTAKMSSEPIAADDEIILGLEVITDNPQTPAAGGYIKSTVPLAVQNGWPNITVSA